MYDCIFDFISVIIQKRSCIKNVFFTIPIVSGYMECVVSVCVCIVVSILYLIKSKTLTIYRVNEQNTIDMGV